MVDYNLIVPLQDLEFKDISIPYYFSENIRFVSTPEFLKKYVNSKIFFSCTDKANLGLCNTCIEMLKIDTCDSHPYVTSDNKNKQAISIIFDLFLSIWISTQNIFKYSNFYVYQDFKSEEPKIPAFYNYPLIYKNQTNVSIDNNNLNEIKNIFIAIKDLNQKSLLHLPISTAITALQQDLLNLRFILFWITLESLFEKKEKKLTDRLIKRIFNFFTKDPNKPEFTKLEKSYNTRSDIIHGTKFLIKDDQSLNDLQELENWVRSSFIKIFSDNQLISNYDSKKGRKRFLNSLNEKSFFVRFKKIITEYFSK